MGTSVVDSGFGGGGLFIADGIVIAVADGFGADLVPGSIDSPAVEVTRQQAASVWPVRPHLLHLLDLAGHTDLTCSVDPQARHWSFPTSAVALHSCICFLNSFFTNRRGGAAGGSTGLALEAS